MSLGTILLIVLILMLVGVLPAWPHSAGWGYAPSGGLGLLALIVLALVLMGRLLKTPQDGRAGMQKASAPSDGDRPPAPPGHVAARLLGRPYESLDPHTQRVARHVGGRRHIARNLAQDAEAAPDRGQRAADAVASFGGSWTFVGLFAATLLSWVLLNTVLLMQRGQTFDPYPFILLNLFLSMLAAVQAPIILMSQNRQAQKDRHAAEHDYEVNLKAELEIMLLHEKIDALRETQWRELLALQQRQLELLADLGHTAPWRPAALAAMAKPLPR